MKSLARAAICALLLATTGCVAITSVPAGPLMIGDKRQVTLGREWSDVSVLVPNRGKKVRVLSIDGPYLNQLYIAQGLAPGEGLLRSMAKEQRVPTFHADMGPTELVELVANSVSAFNYRQVETSKLRPAKFGSTDGLRVDISAKTISGLEMAGTAQIATTDGKLYVILYLAPAEHYFPALLPEIETVMGSAA